MMSERPNFDPKTKLEKAGSPELEALLPIECQEAQDQIDSIRSKNLRLDDEAAARLQHHLDTCNSDFTHQ